MKNLLVILSILTLLFMSCDSRQSAKESLEKSITEFKDYTSSMAFASYYPKQYTETIKDTVISNQVIVKVKNYALMHQNVLISSNTTNYGGQTNYHRVFESEISVHSEERLVYSTHISVENLKPIHPDRFWDNATLEHVWLHQEESSSEFASFHMSFINPQTSDYKLFQMVVDMHGKEQFNLLEES